MRMGTGIATLLLVCVVSCGPPPAPEEPEDTTLKPAEDEPLAQYGPEHVGVPLPDASVCEKNPDGSFKNPVPADTYKGLLRNAKCEQQKFLTMGRVAQALGVKCNYCHEPNPTDPKKENYPAPTENKKFANWMSATFIEGLRPKDGSKMMCSTCHTDPDTGEPVAKILQDPRDRAYAVEWMNGVMASKFVAANGKRLKCKTCHDGLAPDQGKWLNAVKLSRDASRLGK